MATPVAAGNGVRETPGLLEGAAARQSTPARLTYRSPSPDPADLPGGTASAAPLSGPDQGAHSLKPAGRRDPLYDVVGGVQDLTGALYGSSGYCRRLPHCQPNP